MKPPTVWTVGEVLRWTSGFFAERGVDAPRLDAEVLLAHVLGRPRIALYTDHDRPLTATERETFRDRVRRRANGEPVAHLTGEREFWSLPFFVDRRVLVPRPETEVLVEECLALTRPSTEEAEPVPLSRVVDVGTGSGAVAVVLARELPGSPTVYAVDVDAEALAVAAENVRRHDLDERVVLREGHLLGPVSGEGSFELIAANLPYIPTDRLSTLMPDVRLYEPHRALDGGADGATLVRELVDQARPLLTDGGFLVLELDSGAQAAEVARYAETGGGYRARPVREDYAGRPRVLSLEKHSS